MGKALGRGFESLIPTELIDEEFDPTSEEDEKISKLMEVAVSDIIPDLEQARKEFDMEALEALAQSIRANGILQPIVVTREGSKYKIVAGERRWRAASIAGLTRVQVIVRNMDDQRRLEFSIVENAQREDLNPIELGTAYEKLRAQFNFSVQQIAEKVGKSEASVINMLRLLRLPDDVKRLMIENKLTEGVMRPLIPLVPDDEELMREVLARIITEGWTMRQVERYIADKKKRSSATIIKEHLYREEEDRISEKYHATARVRGRTITITCKSKDELEKLLKAI